MHELAAELQVKKAAAPDFVPRLLLHVGRAYVKSCYDLAEINPSMDKVAARWNDAATGLTELLEVVHESFSDSSDLRELSTLQREAVEMSNFYSRVPVLT
jgi:hypothetical protein